MGHNINDVNKNRIFGRDNNKLATDQKVGLIFVLIVFGGIGSCVVKNKIQHDRELEAWIAATTLTPQQQQERAEREKAYEAMQEVRRREIAEVASITPKIGHQVCDNQDGHYRGIVASIHQVNSETVGRYTAYKLTNGQVAAAAIVRVCTIHERIDGPPEKEKKKSIP